MSALVHVSVYNNLAMCSISCICFDRVLGNMVLMKMKLATASSSHPLIGPELVLQIYAKVARAVIRYWTRRKHEKNW
jgi:hypothetical protein